MLQKYWKLVLALLVTATLAACSTAPHNLNSVSGKADIHNQQQSLEMLQQVQSVWAATPYRPGGSSLDGTDCSGFTQFVFKNNFDISLPRTTVGQSQVGDYVTKDSLQTGDLVFFKTGRGPNGYHVGIYVGNDLFIHAATRGGIVYSNLNEAYWKRTYWQSRRVG